MYIGALIWLKYLSIPQIPIWNCLNLLIDLEGSVKIKLTKDLDWPVFSSHRAMSRLKNACVQQWCTSILSAEMQYCSGHHLVKGIAPDDSPSALILVQSWQGSNSQINLGRWVHSVLLKGLIIQDWFLLSRTVLIEVVNLSFLQVLQH